jgi:hypothetical protein
MYTLIRFYNKFTRELAITTALSSSGFIMGYILIDGHKLEKKKLITDYEEKIATLEIANRRLKSANYALEEILKHRQNNK